MTHTDTPHPSKAPPRIDTENDFRWVLRNRTRDSHERLDAMISTLDLTRRDSLIRFFQIHLMCFEAMARKMDHATLDDLIDRMRRDLVALGAEPDLATVEIPAFHPLAADYIIAGSRMGTMVLRKAWAAASDADVLRAGAYFNAPKDSEAWPAVSANLRAVATNGAEAEQIVRDSEAIFAAFANAFESTAPDAQDH